MTATSILETDAIAIVSKSLAGPVLKPILQYVSQNVETASESTLSSVTTATKATSQNAIKTAQIRWLVGTAQEEATYQLQSASPNAMTKS